MDPNNRKLRRRLSHSYMDNDSITAVNESDNEFVEGGVNGNLHQLNKQQEQQNLSRSSASSFVKSTEYTDNNNNNDDDSDNSNNNTHNVDDNNNKKGEKFLDFARRKVDEWDPSLRLKNTASVARDHLGDNLFYPIFRNRSY